MRSVCSDGSVESVHRVDGSLSLPASVRDIVTVVEPTNHFPSGFKYVPVAICSCCKFNCLDSIDHTIVCRVMAHTAGLGEPAVETTPSTIRAA